MPRKVLVVDDERDLADLTDALLGAHGFATVVAYSAADALLALAKDSGIDILFSDIMMPGMTGLQLAKQVRIDYPHIRIVLTSGYTLPTLLAKTDTFYAYLPKPYRIEAVMQLLRA